MLQPGRHLVQEDIEESRVHRQGLVLQAEVEEVRHEGGCYLRVDAFQEARKARVAGEALHEVLVVEDLVPDLPEFFRRQVEKLAAFEAHGVDSVRDPMEFHRRGAQLLGEAAGIGPGALERARLHHDDNVFQLSEVASVLAITEDVSGVLRQQRPHGSLEGERVQTIGGAKGREQQGQEDRQARTAAGGPNQLAQQATCSGNRSHVRCRPRARFGEKEPARRVVDGVATPTGVRGARRWGRAPAPAGSSARRRREWSRS